MNPFRVAGLVGLALLLTGSFALGMKLKQAQWDKTENERLRILTEQLAAEQAKVDRANDILAEAQLRLAVSETEAAELNDRLQEAINQEPVTRTVRVEVPGECPDVSIVLPDAGQHYRLFNCGITGDCDALDTAETGADPVSGAANTP